MTLKYKIDKLCEWIAYHLPKRICYYVYFRVHGFGTSHCNGSKHPAETNCFEAIKCWSEHK